jgi:hypothetical protein
MIPPLSTAAYVAKVKVDCQAAVPTNRKILIPNERIIIEKTAGKNSIEKRGEC